MGFQFYSVNEGLALQALDETLIPKLDIQNHARINSTNKWPRNICSGDINVIRPLYGKLPYMLPLNLDSLRQFRQKVDSRKDLVWSVVWFSAKSWNGDIIQNDNFRTVITFAQAGIQLALQPMQDDIGTNRLYFGPGDVLDCLDKAIHEVEKAATSPNPDGDVVTVLGHGSAANPREHPNYMHHPDHVRIPFQWKICRQPGYDVGKQIMKWRLDACGGSRTYHALEKKYLAYLKTNNLPDPREGERKKLRALGPRNPKRSIEETDASEELDSSSKRQSTDSYYSSGSQQESAIHSYTSSPEFPRPPSVAGPIMSPPFPPASGQPGAGIERAVRQPRSRGSRGSLKSASSYVGSRLAGLRFQSSGGSSPEGLPPPPEGSVWGGPRGMARNAPGHFGGGFEPQIQGRGQQSQGVPQQFPGPGYQGPGQLQQSQSYGKLTEVYGHLTDDFQGPPSPEWRVGVPHTQQVARYGGQIPPPGQQRMPAEQAAAQLSNQHARAGLWPPQIASGAAGPWSSNMPLPGPGPNIQHGGGYSGSFSPLQPVIHGGGAHLPQQPQHLMAAQAAGRNIQSNFPPDAPPMSRPEDMAPLYPPATRGTEPSLTQPPTTRAQGGGNHPSSFPPVSRSMPAGPIHRPEDEFLSADAGLYSEPELEGGDDQPDYGNVPVSQPLQYPGDQGNVQIYQSRSPIGGHQPAYMDPFWGASESEGNHSGED